MRLNQVLIATVIGLLGIFNVAQAGQAVTSLSGGVVVVDEKTTDLTPAETAIVTENFLGVRNMRVFNRHDSVVFSFIKHEEAVRFSHLLHVQHINSISRPGQLKRVQREGRFYRVYLSKPQYGLYKLNLISTLNSRAAAHVTQVKPAINQAPVKKVVVKSHKPKQKSAHKTRRAVSKARPTRPIVVNAKRKRQVVYIRPKQRPVRFHASFPIKVNKHTTIYTGFSI